MERLIREIRTGSKPCRPAEAESAPKAVAPTALPELVGALSQHTIAARESSFFFEETLLVLKENGSCSASM